MGLFITEIFTSNNFRILLHLLNTSLIWSKFQDAYQTSTGSGPPWQKSFPIVKFAFPLKNPYLKPSTGSNVRFVIFVVSIIQSCTEGKESQLQRLLSVER